MFDIRNEKTDIDGVMSKIANQMVRATRKNTPSVTNEPETSTNGTTPRRANHYVNIDEIQIESGIPFYGKRNRAGKWRELLAKMKDGQCFTVGRTKYPSIYEAAKKLSIVVATEAVDKDTIRVFRNPRIAKPVAA